MLHRLTTRLAATALLGLTTVGAPAADLPSGVAPDGYSQMRLANRRVAGVHALEGRVTTIYGAGLAHGASPAASAEAFLRDDLAVLGSTRRDLVPVGPFPGGEHQIPTGYVRATGAYKHTIVGYSQERDGIPVFRGSVKLIVGNGDGYPLLAVKNGLRELGAFRPDVAALPRLGSRRLADLGADVVPGLDRFSGGELVIWAGLETDLVVPRLARSYIAEGGRVEDDSVQRWLLLVDARTGELLYREDQILRLDIVGNVSGNVTDDIGADTCGPELPRPLPYLRVDVSGGNQVFADADGNFIIPHGGTSDVTVVSPMIGEFFFLDNEQGIEETLSVLVTPPGPASFLHNADNTDEFVRSQSNAYTFANEVRDYALFYNPAFPVIGAETGFEINVNRAATCNATYSSGGPSINFYASGGGCPNSALATIVHHEYGHHLVQVSNGGNQGAYGEGYGDVQGVMVTDDPGSGHGFFGPCDTPARTADNTMQYPCSGPIHTCGTLISGCVWDTRNELIVTEPVTYRDVLGNMVYNAMPMHTPSSTIAPDITIDYLMADDDDGDIGNGTPHYTEVANGFGAHNMDAPPLLLLDFDFPNGLPDLISPSGTTTVRVDVLGLAGVPQPGTGTLHFDDGGGVVEIAMSEGSANEYTATFPATACGTGVTYYFSAETTAGSTQFSPAGAPTDRYSATAAEGQTVIATDDFETDQGWTVENENLTDGPWERGVPVNGNRGDPPADQDGSGQCYVTDNVSGNSDVDGGPTRLISPTFDLSSNLNAGVEYARWFTNDDNDADSLDVHVSNDDGGSWTLVSSTGNQIGWTVESFRVADYLTPTATVKVRFSATDNPNDSVTEAGVDRFRIVDFSCGGGCVEDIDGSGSVDFGDVLAILAAWGNAGGPEDLDGSGTVDFGDLLAVLAAWGPCP